MVCPVVKTSLTVLLPVAVAAAPVLTALGSMEYGLFYSTKEGVSHGFNAAVDGATEDVKTFHQLMSPKLIEALQGIETMELPEGQKPYDIKVIETGKGLICIVPRTLID